MNDDDDDLRSYYYVEKVFGDGRNNSELLNEIMELAVNMAMEESFTKDNDRL